MWKMDERTGRKLRIAKMIPFKVTYYQPLLPWIATLLESDSFKNLIGYPLKLRDSKGAAIGEPAAVRSQLEREFLEELDSQKQDWANFDTSGARITQDKHMERQKSAVEKELIAPTNERAHRIATSRRAEDVQWWRHESGKIREPGERGSVSNWRILPLCHLPPA